MSTSSSKVLVANLSAPEITRLAAELARRGLLARYVRPYANKGRWWERLIERTPKLGSVYARTFGRRRLPEGVPPAKILEAGVLEDFTAAVAARLPIGSSTRRRQFSQRMMFQAERAVARTAGRYAHEADIVVASYGTGVEAFTAMRRKGGRAVLSYPIAHNGFQRKFYAEEAALSPEFAPALPDFGMAPADYEKRLDEECHAASCILVGSRFAREAFLAEGYDADKVVAISYGVDAIRFTPPQTPKQDGVFRVLFVGQLGQRKGLSYLLQGYELFRKPDSELQLVGGFVQGSEVYDRFRSLFQHTAQVPQAGLPQIYRQADVFVFPTLVEGMGLVVLEAMACGLPAIVTDRGPGDLVTEGVDGFIVPIRDPEAIAIKLERLYRDPELRSQMGRNARSKALACTWDSYAARAADAVIATD